MSMKLDYQIPFKAVRGQDSQLAVKENLINIEGTAIDASVNSNKWQVPEEDLDFFVSSLQGSQMRIDHAESAMAVIGRVPEARRNGQEVLFRAEIGDATIIQKVLRGYLTHVSVQVDSDDVECSVCHKQTRKEGMLVHLCPGAWEIVHKPRVRELSIVASPAYKHTEFKPVGFAAAMDESQGRYNEVTDRMRDVQQRIRDQRRSVGRPDKNDLLTRVDTLRQKVNDLEIDELREKLQFMKRLDEMLQKIRDTKNEDYSAEAEGIEAEFKTPLKIQKEFLNAIKKFNMQKNSHTAMQLEKLMEHQQLVERFGDYFADAQNFERLKRLVFS